MGRGKDRGRRVFSLVYANDIVLLAEEEGGDEKYDRETGEVFRKERTGIECR